ncbi:UDP-sugar:glycosyltransferase [Striga asiatica]|uniref:UDP-sugar:glycosyltransferase n=1 Tax=Striga asiatica TaxID=4170 RepID=A0A5A7R969_STRAF|nr:UDP-sugar:glycosyltransferase [Striga asiatica]
MASSLVLSQQIKDRGHLQSTLERAKALIHRDPRLSVTVFLIKPPFEPNGYIPSSYGSDPRILFVDIPKVEPSPGPLVSFVPFITRYIDGHKDHVRNEAAQLMARPAGFIVDMFCTGMADVARELAVPTYVYFTSITRIKI